MIVRIMGGQWKLADDKVDTLNEVDAKLEGRGVGGRPGRVRVVLRGLLDLVRGQGEKLIDG